MSQPSRPKPVVIVTGAASGIGAAVAARLEADGAKVAGWDRQSCQGLSLSQQVDVGDAEAVAAAAQQVAERLGPPTQLVHAAGITRDGVLWKLSEADWNDVLRVNLGGAFFLLKAITPYLRAHGGGSAVLIGSINGGRGKFGQTAYAASKAGLVGLARSAARELGRFGGRVNVLAPGMVRTPMTEKLPEAWQQKAIDETVLGRVATVDDIAGVAAFLLSSDAQHLTGQVLHVDGGQYMA